MVATRFKYYVVSLKTDAQPTRMYVACDMPLLSPAGRWFVTDDPADAFEFETPESATAFRNALHTGASSKAYGISNDNGHLWTVANQL